MDKIMERIKKKSLTPKDYEYMHSLSGAVLEMTPKWLLIVLYFWVGTISVFLLWASFAYVDEIARGDGAIIPSGHNQMIQNLEGGIIEEILVKEGDEVEKGEVLLKIDNQKSQSSFSTSNIKANSLKAKISRLTAEANGVDFVITDDSEFMQNEMQLYLKRLSQLNAQTQVLKEQLIQREQELRSSKVSLSHLKSSFEMISTELEMAQPMVEKGVKSRIDYLKLQRETNETEERYNSLRLAIPKLESSINEMKESIKQINFDFQSKSQEELNTTKAELESILSNSVALEDQVSRTLVRSPMKGIVQKMFVNTVGGVIKPADNIIEIVPSDETLLIEVKIKPSDIAFIYHGQKAIVKFSAYDFAIFGGLEGEVVHISADTIKDQKDNVFYTVRIKTQQNFLEKKGNVYKIIPGMTVNVDIITGKKTVLDYILKPILKTKQYTFSEK
ncbi:MAG: HlyD family type I secretion periplasmic adaptor subunit [Arcobacteraceae bacterium]|nr:HlyD family type I secretion periplasmic adaptor subunit [Arcobacteraceae bacterium]